MIGTIKNFTASSSTAHDRKLHRSRPEDFVRFTPTGEPPRWPSLGGK